MSSAARKLATSRLSSPHHDGVANSLTPSALAAARSGDEDLMNLLLRSGANSHGTDENGYTLLHLAVLAKSAATVRAALSAGVAIDARSKLGESAVDLAVKIRADDIAKILGDAEKKI
jgi:ankyrin repeat protein